MTLPVCRPDRSRSKPRLRARRHRSARRGLVRQRARHVMRRTGRAGSAPAPASCRATRDRRRSCRTGSSSVEIRSIDAAVREVDDDRCRALLLDGSAFHCVLRRHRALRIERQRARPRLPTSCDAGVGEDLDLVVAVGGRRECPSVPTTDRRTGRAGRAAPRSTRRSVPPSIAAAGVDGRDLRHQHCWRC